MWSWICLEFHYIWICMWYVCDVGEYLDYTKRRKGIIYKIVEKFDEGIDGKEMNYNATLNNQGSVCKYCTLYVVLLILTFKIILGISGACFYFYWHTLKNCFNKLSINYGR